MKIAVKTNLKVVDRNLLNMHRKQIPFATAGALTSTAFDVRKELVERTYQRAFNLRNSRFPAVVTNVKKANKQNLTATVGNIKGDEISAYVDGQRVIFQRSLSASPGQFGFCVPADTELKALRFEVLARGLAAWLHRRGQNDPQ